MQVNAPVNSKPENISVPPATGLPPDAGQSAGVLRVRMGGRDRAVPLSELDAVIDRPAISRVPAAPDWLMGVAGYKGGLLPVVDLAAASGEPQAAAPKPGIRLLLVEAAAHRIAFSVDDILAQDLDPPPDDTAAPIALRALVARLIGAAPAAGRAPRTERSAP